MKVKELIKYLKTLDQEALIMTRGYEGGYCDINTANEEKIKLNVNSEWWYGPHDDTDDEIDNKTVFKTYII